MFAIYKKDLQSYFYSPFAYVICALFMMVFSISFVSGIANLSSDTLSFSFPDVFYVNFFYFIFLIPILTMKSFADERKNGTEILLNSSPVSIPKIVFGKFLAIVTIFLVMIILSFAYPLITVLKGQVYWSTLICGYIGFFAMGLICIAIGMLMSSITETSVIAAVASEAVVLGMLFIDKLNESVLVTNAPALSKIFSWFSTQARFDQFSLGIFSLADLIFYLTFVILILAWTMIVLTKRRFNRG